MLMVREEGVVLRLSLLRVEKVKTFLSLSSALLFLLSSPCFPAFLSPSSHELHLHTILFAGM